jgi:hydrogenase nickel incorporation protein HypA/HybF
MHELNVLMEVADQVEALAAESKIEKVKAIVLQIGELSSVVPMFMEQYYPMIAEKKNCLQESKLVIERIPGKARCVNCGEVYHVVEHDGHCPVCNTFKKVVLQGCEFIIKEIWV